MSETTTRLFISHGRSNSTQDFTTSTRKCSLTGTNYGISQDFPREIVEIRKGLVKVMKEAKKNG